MNPLLDKPAVVYKATNPIKGHFYIGVTGNFKARKVLHLWTVMSEKRGRAPFYKAMRKYGIEAFKWEIIGRYKKGSLALAAEKRLIQSLRPHYNATPGGEGFSPTVISEEGRRRISEAHKGKQYRLGIPHTQETKDRLRELGLRDKGKWLQRSHLGSAARAKRRVVCLNDGTLHPSASAAARAYGVAGSALTEVCLKRSFRRTCGGLVFRYEGDHHNGAAQIEEANALTSERKAHANDWKKRSVQCLDDGRVFAGALEATQFYGMPPMSRYMIGDMCRGKPKANGKYTRSVHGRRFAYANAVS